jgi:cytochrome P450
VLTPGRLKENEESMWRLADRQLEEVVADGRCEFISDYAGPFAMLVIADLLGVPEEDHDDFRRGLAQRSR